MTDPFPWQTVSFRGVAFGARSMLCRESVRANAELGLGVVAEGFELVVRLCPAR